ncbi:MAG: peptidase M23, partial [Marinobacter sp.]
MSPSSDVEAKRMSYPVDLNQGTVSGSGAPVIDASTAKNNEEQTIETSTPGNSVAQAIAATKAPPAAIAAPEAPEIQWKEFRIKSGDTLSSLFKKAGFNDGIMLSVIHGDGEADKLQRLYA